MGISTIPRRIPPKREPTTDLETNSSHSSIMEPTNDSRCSDENMQGPVLDESSNMKKEIEELPEPAQSSSPQDNVDELSTRRGSFSLVQQKVYEDNNSPGPLDLTPEQIVSANRPEIEERA